MAVLPIAKHGGTFDAAHQAVILMFGMPYSECKGPKGVLLWCALSEGPVPVVIALQGWVIVQETEVGHAL